MLNLIFLLVIGGVMVYLSQHNLTPVTLHIGTYVLSDIPLFYIIIGSLLIGLGLAYMIYLVDSIFTSFSLRGKDQEIKQAKNEIVQLTKRVHTLELENKELRNDSGIRDSSDANSL
jgi:uncharacterized membrane protein